MDALEKCKVRLDHWINHNVEHLKGYLEVAQILEAEGQGASASCVRDGIRLVQSANAEFQKALASMPCHGEPSAENEDMETHAH